MPITVQRALRQVAAGVPVPFGVPQQAQQFANAKRLPPDRRVDTRALYAAAERRLQRMPVYDSALGRHLSGPELRARSSGKRALRGKWKPLGPGNIGGRTRALAIDASRPATMYAGGVSGGVWKTTNGGSSWSSASTGLENVAVNSMVIRPGKPKTLFVGTGEGYFRETVRGTGLPLRGGGIFRTTRAGKQWERLASTAGEDFWFVNDLEFSADGERLYAATRSGVFRSDDQGTSWARLLDPTATGGCLDLALRTDVDDDVLFASCGTFEQATVWRSKDASSRSGEVTFEAVLRDPGMGRTSLAIAGSDQDVVYALAASNVQGDYEQALHAVFRSSVGGDAGSWEARLRNTDPRFSNTLLLHNAVIAQLSACGFSGTDDFLPMGWYVNAIAVDPVDPDVVWAAGVDWFRSDDGGSSWGPASFWWASPGTPSMLHSDQHVLAFHPDYDGDTNQTILVGNDGGIYRSDNARAGVSTGGPGLCNPASTAVIWKPLNNSFEVTQFYAGLPFPDGDGVLGGAQDNGTLLGAAGNANGWLRVLGGDGGYVAIDPRDRRVLYAESQNGNLAKSVDGGANFFPARNGLPPGDGRFLDPGGNFVFITPFVLDPNNPDRLWIGGQSMYRSIDGAASWQPASVPLKGRVSAIAVAESDSNHLAAGTEKGWLYVNSDALAASGATRWAASRPRRAWLTWVTFDPADSDILYATYGGFGDAHVFRSDDGGRAWRSIDGSGSASLPDIPVHAVVIDPVDTARIYLGTDLGVFVSTDRGISWAQENAGFGNIVTESLHLQQEGNRRRLYAFTHGRGAWRVNLRK